MNPQIKNLLNQCEKVRRYCGFVHIYQKLTNVEIFSVVFNAKSI